MKLLLDSQIVFWWMAANPQLSKTVLAHLNDSANQCFVSPISHWEMAIKMSVSDFDPGGDFVSIWKDTIAHFTLLPIQPRHSARLIDLPFHHRDPFDRMLVAQALAEGMPLVSSDRKLDAYGVPRIW